MAASSELHATLKLGGMQVNVVNVKLFKLSLKAQLADASAF
jgi:hypothetical protein